MDATRLLGALVGLIVATVTLGAAVSLGASVAATPFSVAVLAVLALVALALLVLTGLGARSREWLDSGGYW